LIDEAVAAAPKQANVANAAGQVLLEGGRYEEALRRFREAIDLSPDSPQLWFNAARAQLALTQRQAARESLGKALSLRPDWLPAAVLMAQIDSREGRTEAALATASKLKRSAEPAVGWMLEGEIRMAMKDYPGAEKAFAESFKLKPSAPGALARYNARRSGKMPQPEQVLVDWLADHPDDARVRFALAEARQAQGDYKAAIREYELMLAKSPNSAIVLNNLAWLYSETGNTRAEDLAARAYKAAPDSWAIADTYGWILVRANKPKEGLAILKQAVEKSNNNAEVLYHLGVAQSKAGETVAAKETLSRAVADARGAPWKAEAEKVLESAK
jgi:putative PEP-CTERM system TPR-repeat lipoprotein